MSVLCGFMEEGVLLVDRRREDLRFGVDEVEVEDRRGAVGITLRQNEEVFGIEERTSYRASTPEAAVSRNGQIKRG